MLRLKARDERPLAADQLMMEMRRKLSVAPGVQVYIQNPPPIRVGGMMTRALYQYTLQGPDVEELYASAQEFEKELAQLPALQDVQTGLLPKKPILNVSIDREKAAAMRLTAEQIETALASAYSTRFISNICTPATLYQVIMEARPEYQDRPEALSLLYVRSGNGRLVPLDAVASLSETIGPQSFNHLGQLPAVTISFNLAPGYGAGGEARQPLGLSVAGGLIFSQLVTLYLTPVYYTYLAQAQSWFRRRTQATGELRPEPSLT